MAAKVTSAVAAAGVFTPVWLPELEHVSREAALWLPVVSVIWIVAQTIVLLVRFLGKKNE